MWRLSFYCSFLVSCCSSKGEAHQANGSPTQETPTNAGERMPAQPGTPEPEPGAEYDHYIKIWMITALLFFRFLSAHLYVIVIYFNAH